MILFGLIFGRSWRITLVAAALVWPWLVVEVVGFNSRLIGPAVLGVLNAGVGVLVHQGVLFGYRQLRRPASQGVMFVPVGWLAAMLVRRPESRSLATPPTADFAEGLGDDVASRRLAGTLQRRGVFRRFNNELYEHYPELISAWHALRSRSRSRPRFRRARGPALPWLHAALQRSFTQVQRR